mmetsp:Transcript_675/g.1762  ORF Transcript_675/g.1762 Transcript_675/m.1762 type:complete len:238 (-) Transcript_675:75-788(-)
MARPRQLRPLAAGPACRAAIARAHACAHTRTRRRPPLAARSCNGRTATVSHTPWPAARPRRERAAAAVAPPRPPSGRRACRAPLRRRPPPRPAPPPQRRRQRRPQRPRSPPQHRWRLQWHKRRPRQPARARSVRAVAPAARPPNLAERPARARACAGVRVGRGAGDVGRRVRACTAVACERFGAAPCAPRRRSNCPARPPAGSHTPRPVRRATARKRRRPAAAGVALVQGEAARARR